MNGPGTGTGRTGGLPGEDGGDGGMPPGGTGGGTGPGPDGSGPHSPMEERLRRALAARAGSIGVRDLRPAAPPGPHLRRGPLSGLQQPWLRRFGLPLAAAAMVAVGYLVTAPGGPPDRPLPARPPSPVAPAPSSTYSGPAPGPSPSEPPAGPRHSTGPSGARPPGTARPSRSSTPTARPTGQPGEGRTGTPGPPSATPSATPTPAGSSIATHPASPSTQAVH